MSYNLPTPPFSNPPTQLLAISENSVPMSLSYKSIPKFMLYTPTQAGIPFSNNIVTTIIICLHYLSLKEALEKQYNEAMYAPILTFITRSWHNYSIFILIIHRSRLIPDLGKRKWEERQNYVKKANWKRLSTRIFWNYISQTSSYFIYSDTLLLSEDSYFVISFTNDSGLPLQFRYDLFLSYIKVTPFLSFLIYQKWWPIYYTQK